MKLKTSKAIKLIILNKIEQINQKENRYQKFCKLLFGIVFNALACQFKPPPPNTSYHYDIF